MHAVIGLKSSKNSRMSRFGCVLSVRAVFGAFSNRPGLSSKAPVGTSPITSATAVKGRTHPRTASRSPTVRARRSKRRKLRMLHLNPRHQRPRATLARARRAMLHRQPKHHPSPVWWLVSAGAWLLLQFRLWSAVRWNVACACGSGCRMCGTPFLRLSSCRCVARCAPDLGLSGEPADV